MRNIKDITVIYLLFLAASVVYIIGLFLDVMDVDAAQYASLTKQMVDSGSYLQVFYRGNNYLDKPPLLFWITSLSYKLLGISNFSYKLPSFLFTLLGVYSTFRLGKLLYNYRTGIIAALMLYCCQGFFMFNSDVRTDAALSGAVIFASWQLLEYVYSKRLRFLLGGSLGVALALLAKGPIGFVIPVAAVFGDLVLKKKWKQLFDWHWLIAGALVFALLGPMLYGLMEQYGMYGWRFYFWIQSFGRITGESEWNNGNDYSFFLHTTLWSFLPWSIVAYVASGNFIYRLFSKKTPAPTEYACICAALIPLAALSLSHYKLPHYIFPTFPFLAILAAEFVLRYDSFQSKARAFHFIQYFILVLSVIAAVVFCLIFKVSVSVIVYLLLALMIMSAAFFLIPSFRKELIYLSAAGSIFLNLAMNVQFYPQLLKYQPSHAMADYLLSRNVNPQKVLLFHDDSPSFDFYMRDVIQVADSKLIDKDHPLSGYWLYTNRNGIKELSERGIPIKQLVSFPHFGITILNLKFLNPGTRQSVLQERILVEL